MHPSLFELEAIFEDYEHSTGMNVLGASDAETFTIKELEEMAGGSLGLENVSLGYDDVKGRESLRDVIAKSYTGAGLSDSNVLVTVGASEAILLALHTLLSPGDRALVCRPCYQGLYEMAEAAGAEVSYYEYAERDGFAPDLNMVRAALDESPPKVLVLNTPHNPTGQALDEETLRDLLARARAVNTRVIVDEVFSGIWIKPTRPVPSAMTLDPQAIVIGCLSKVYGLAGLRVGWLAGPKDFIEECKRLRYYTSLSPPAIVQQLAEAAMIKRHDILQRSQQNVEQNYARATNWLNSHREFFDWFPPQAGTVMLLRLKLPVNTDKFARHLAETCNVFLVPCTTAFGMTDRYLRLGLGGNVYKFKEGLDIVSYYLLDEKWRILPNSNP